MDATHPVILKVATPDHGRVVIDASNGMRYETDLGSFSDVYCYPRTRAAWDEVTADSSGYALVWTSRFEVHIDQVIALANRVTPIQRSA
jgi:hypothetical protein